MPKKKEQKAWECPRCHKVNSPSTEQCVCQPTVEEAPDLSTIEGLIQAYAKGTLETTPFFSDSVVMPS